MIKFPILHDSERFNGQNDLSEPFKGFFVFGHEVGRLRSGPKFIQVILGQRRLDAARRLGDDLVQQLFPSPRAPDLIKLRALVSIRAQEDGSSPRYSNWWKERPA